MLFGSWKDMPTVKSSMIASPLLLAEQCELPCTVKTARRSIPSAAKPISFFWCHRQGKRNLRAYSDSNRPRTIFLRGKHETHHLDTLARFYCRRHHRNRFFRADWPQAVLFFRRNRWILDSGKLFDRLFYLLADLRQFQSNQLVHAARRREKCPARPRRQARSK